MGMVFDGRYKLSWMKDKSRRWRKVYKGKPYYFPLRESETKESSYPRCLAAWKEKKAELDAASLSPWDVARSRIRSRMEKLSEGVDTPERRQAYYLLQGALSGLAWAEKESYPTEDLAADLATSEDAFPLIMRPASDIPDPLTDGPAPWDIAPDRSTSETIAGNVDDFLRSKRAEADRGKLSRQHVDKFRYSLEDFSSFVGDRLLSALNSELLSSYHEELRKRIDAGKSAAYVKIYSESVTQYVRWLYSMERVETLPRVLEGKSNRLTISVPKKEIETYDKSELKTLFNRMEESDDDLRLYVLLMLNCGFTQKDVADLRREEVDLEAGTISRKRSKTDHHENTPLVVYPLWEETLSLLRSQIQTSGDLALLNRNGKPLRSESISKDEKLGVTDNIGLRFRRFKKRLVDAEGEKKVVIDKPLKAMRSTAASKLGEHESYSRFAQYFLGHSAKTVADKHYVKPAQGVFCEAIAWLRTELGIDALGDD
ncbi:site-specific integrase [Blastopirellula sp. J2-11]|uniref:tyrosine-type recombinase/integrase n=1 Tax=Blastopirellula sp. J2-11 TaxID=2943192 RepID=UPI0021C6F937|nr:site-specific integrase [Blastopirellula sp. J2-11]UUO06936.1 site-specific integrase [Blastopirellula sp. J2-11]